MPIHRPATLNYQIGSDAANTQATPSISTTIFEAAAIPIHGLGQGVLAVVGLGSSSSRRGCA
jgi:hypothetical protein